jgi:hypothetical protein
MLIHLSVAAPIHLSRPVAGRSRRWARIRRRLKPVFDATDRSDVRECA